MGYNGGSKRGPRASSRKGKKNFIAAWRTFRGFESQGQLADKSGVSRETICRLESGKLPYKQYQLEKLAVALDCSTGDLISVDPWLLPDIIKVYLKLPPEKRARARAGDLITHRRQKVA